MVWNERPRTELTMKRVFSFPILLLLGSFGILYHAVIIKLVQDWSADANYSHGFLVVPVASYFAWERRHQFRTAHPRPAAIGLIVVLCSLVLLLVGVFGAEVFTTEVSM